MAGHQDQSSRQVRQLLDDGRQMQIVDVVHLIGNYAEADGHCIPLEMGVDAEAMAAGDLRREVQVAEFLELLHLLGAHHGQHHGACVLIGDRRSLHVDQLRVPSQHRRHPHVDMHVTGAILNGQCENVLDVNHNLILS